MTFLETTNVGIGSDVVLHLASYTTGIGIDTDPRRYVEANDENGATVGAEFRINTTTAGTQDSLNIAALADSEFVTFWVTSAAGTIS